LVDCFWHQLIFNYNIPWWAKKPPLKGICHHHPSQCSPITTPWHSYFVFFPGWRKGGVRGPKRHESRSSRYSLNFGLLSMFLSKKIKQIKATILTTNQHFLLLSQINIVHQLSMGHHTTQVNINSLLVFVYLPIGPTSDYSKVKSKASNFYQSLRKWPNIRQGNMSSSYTKKNLEQVLMDKLIGRSTWRLQVLSFP
jgi:hypothetical protein